MYQNIPTKVLTGEVRLSYANLTAPRAAQQGGEAKYSVTLLIPKTDTATKANIDSSAEAAAQDALGKLWNGVRPPVLPVPSTCAVSTDHVSTPQSPSTEILALR